MSTSGRVLLVALALATVAVAVQAGKVTKFSREMNVPLYTNKIGPFANPSVAYHYNSYPLCKPVQAEPKKQRQGLVDKLDGTFKQPSLYAIKYKINQELSRLCEVTWTREDIAKMHKAIKQQFYYEYVLGELDDLPVRGFLGYFDEATGKANIFLHQHFTILYHTLDAQKGLGALVYANVTSSAARSKEVTYDLEHQTIEFTYSVDWVESDADPKKRYYLADGFFAWSQTGGKVHWLNIFNSLLLVLLLAGFLALVLFRILRKDLARYEANLAKDAEDPLDGELEYGWKLIHGDVFRFPPFRSFFCAFIGVGSQFVAMSAVMLFLALTGLYYPGNEGAIDVSGIVLYALTAVIAGERSTFFYTHMGGTAWSWNVVLTATLFAAPFFLVMALLNTMSVVRDLVTAVHIDGALAVLAIWIFIGLPLTLLGGIAGKRRASAAPFAAPVRTKNFLREIPQVQKIYNRLPVQMLIGGLLPFGAIYLEMHYLFDAVWGHAMYQLFGILAIVFILLLLVTALTTVAIIFFQLSAENWKWWWNSFIIGGSAGLFIFAFSVHWWYRTSSMFGWMQWSFYFLQMAVVSYYFFIMLGTVAFFACLAFIRAIYGSLRIE